jgi:hypothetical protein
LQFRLLLGVQTEAILEHDRQYLARLRASAESARAGHSRLSIGRTAWTALTSLATPARPTVGRSAARRPAEPAAWPAAAGLGHLGLERFRERCQLLFGDDAILVGIGALEETMQPLVRYLIDGELTVAILVEGEQTRRDG